jgi:phospholipid-binding lipoprotein MlaA
MRYFNFLVLIGLLLLSACAKQDTNIHLNSLAIEEGGVSVINETEEYSSLDVLLEDTFLDEDGEGNNTDEVSEPKMVSDPLEFIINRPMFWANDILYTWVFDPMYNGYVYVTPKYLRELISNLYYNSTALVRVVSLFGQGRVEDALIELGECVTNFVLGAFGLFDLNVFDEGVVSDANIGQLFKHYGVGSGWYLVLPITGPSDVRAGLGLLAGSYLTVVPYIEDIGTQWGVRLGEVMSSWEVEYGAYQDARTMAATDLYETTRNLYFQKYMK